MATRPLVKLDFACRLELVTDAAYARGKEVKFGSDDLTITAAGTNDVLAIGTLERAVTAAGKAAAVVLYGHAIVPVIVGTGGATRGKDAITAADGFTDAPTNGTGTVSNAIKGKFMQSGVAGDEVGLLIGFNPRSVAGS